LHRWVRELSATHLEKLVDLIEKWNSNRKMASLAHMLMGIVLTEIPPSKLMAIEGMNASCVNLLSYSSRHMSRVEALLQKTFLFDIVLQSGPVGLSLQDDQQAGDVGTEGTSAELALKRTMQILLGADKEEDDDVIIHTGAGNAAYEDLDLKGWGEDDDLPVVVQNGPVEEANGTSKAVSGPTNEGDGHAEEEAAQLEGAPAKKRRRCRARA